MTATRTKSHPVASLWNATIDLLLPPRCAGTGEVVDAQGMLSPGFWSQLTFIENPQCSACGVPFDFNTPMGSLCGACMDEPPVFDRARSAVVYNEASRTLVMGFKYGDRLHTTLTFAPWLHRAGAELLAETDFIIPVPLHRRRLWERRYNQSALLGEALAKRAAKRFLPDGLARLRHTVQQKGLSRKERLANVKGAFAVNERYLNELRGKNVMLIDDVFTSGATLNECAKTLKKHGAEKVFVLTIARVTREENF